MEGGIPTSEPPPRSQNREQQREPRGAHRPGRCRTFCSSQSSGASGLSSWQKPASRLSRILAVIFFGGEEGPRKGQISSKPGRIVLAVGGGLVDGRPAGPPLPLPTPDRFIPRNIPEDFDLGTYIFFKCKKVLGVDYDNCFSTFLLQIICGVFASA